MKVAQNVLEWVGNTPIVRIASLSQLTGCEIYLKCESVNPGGSIKDRAAKQMVLDAIASQKLKPGMSIVEGTAGNTGIGLALIAKALGYGMTAVMPKGQTIEKQRMLQTFGADLVLVDPVPFKDSNHFYHTARRLAEEKPEHFWWADQFENLSNFKAHYEGTGPEIYQQLGDQLDWLVSAAGTGGTLAGTSRYLTEKLPKLKVRLLDPQGSGLKSYLESGEFKAQGSSITEGIGIMRLVANFSKAKIDDAIVITDQQLVDVAYHVRSHDGILLGSSSALNVAGALLTALEKGPGQRILTFLCDLGERSYSKLYNPDFLKEKGLSSGIKPFWR